MSNLDNVTRGTNSDWAMWVKMVKKAYKAKGYNLTQQQALMVAKDSYPGKGNVINRKPKELDKMANGIQINDEIPENPVRRKKEPKPREKPEVYRREKSPPRNRRLKYSSDDSPPRKYKKTRQYKREDREDSPRRSRDDRNDRKESPPRRRRERSRSPPRRNKYYSSDEESPPRRRKR